MYIFGGILELTKELDEFLVYDFASGCFCLAIGGDDAVGGLGPDTRDVGAMEESPAKIKK